MHSAHVVTRSRLVERIEAASTRPPTLGASVEGAVSLAMGEPFGGTPSTVVDAAVEALRTGRTRYEQLSGSPTLRGEVAAHLSAYADTTLSSGEVVLTHGASAGLAATILAVVDPGDKVVLLEPTYSLYADHVSMAGGTVEWVATAGDGRLPLDALDTALADAAMIVLCNPSNPTGRVTPGADLAAAVELAARHGAVVLCDEAYCDIVFDGLEFVSVLDFFSSNPHVVCCGTFSKSYAMTGWRLGWVVAHEELASKINLVHRTFNGALNTFVQDAAASALALPPEHLERLRAEFQSRRDLVVEALSGVPGVQMATPQGAFYAFPQVDTPLSSLELQTHLSHRGVLVRAGSEYGPSGEGHIRLSFATDTDSLQLGLERFVSAVRDLPHA